MNRRIINKFFNDQKWVDIMTRTGSGYSWGHGGGSGFEKDYGFVDDTSTEHGMSLSSRGNGDGSALIGEKLQNGIASESNYEGSLLLKGHAF